MINISVQQHCNNIGDLKTENRKRNYIFILMLRT